LFKGRKLVEGEKRVGGKGRYEKSHSSLCQKKKGTFSEEAYSSLEKKRRVVAYKKKKERRAHKERLVASK